MSPVAEVTPGRRGGRELIVLEVGDALVEVAAWRGGLVARYQVRGRELLALDEATFADAQKNVRGGIPVLFPWAGKPAAGSPLPQHGFARTREWRQGDSKAEGAVAWTECTLTDDEASRQLFPHRFRLTQRVTLTAEQLEVRHTVTALDAPMPVHFGLHPYFAVAPGLKQKVTVDARAELALDTLTGQRGPVPAFDFTGELDLHLRRPAVAAARLALGDGASIELRWSSGYQALVLWTQPGKPFVCVEPWSDLALAHGGTARLLQPREQAEWSFSMALV